MLGIENYTHQIKALCIQYNVESLYLFGSANTENFNNESDIDVLVKFGLVNPCEYFKNYLDFKTGLENTFGRKIDLLEAQTLQNPVLIRSINRNKRMIYG